MKDSLKKKRDELANKVAEEVFGEYETLEEEEANSFIGIVSDFSKGFDACHSLMEDEVRGLTVALKKCKDDYWFMINLIEKYGSDKDQVLKDCAERMKFRMPMFENAMRSQAEGVDVTILQKI